MFGDLPSEILLHIFSHLPPVDLLQCRRVSRAFCALASDDTLWCAIEERLERHLRAHIHNPTVPPWIFDPSVLRKEPRFRRVVKNALIGLDFRRHKKALYRALSNSARSNLFHVACSVRFPYYFKRCTCGHHGVPWMPREGFRIGCYAPYNSQPCYWIPARKNEIRSRKDSDSFSSVYRTEDLRHFLYPYLKIVAPFRTSTCHERNRKRKRHQPAA